MKRNMLAKRLMASALTGILVMSTGMTAFAIEGEETPSNLPKNVTITKVITKDSKLFVPSGNFEFKITPLTEQTGLVGADEGALASPVNGATISEDNKYINSTPDVSNIGVTEVTVGSTTITINSEAFERPGVYQYLVEEVIPEDNEKLDGVTYSTEDKYFNVYVNSDLEAYAYTFVDEDAEDGKDDGIFENGYNKEEGELYDLTVTKTVTGNQGEKNREFQFTISITGEEGEKYYVEYGKEVDGVYPENITVISGASETIPLADGETAIIYGLDSNDTYTISEENLTEEGYKTTVNDKSGNEATGTISTDTTIEFKNDKSVSTPTGIAMTFAPYAVMVVFAGIFAVMFLRKKREDF